MKNAELKRLEREATAQLNRRMRLMAGDLPYAQLRMVYGYRLANAETRRLVRAEAKRRGYKLAAFGG